MEFSKSRMYSFPHDSDTSNLMRVFHEYGIHGEVLLKHQSVDNAGLKLRFYQ